MKRIFLFIPIIYLLSCQPNVEEVSFEPKFKLIPTDTFHFNSFVDCNMAEAWIGDTYGEDPLWGDSRELKFADGMNPDEAFASDPAKFTEPLLPPNAPIGEEGLHGAIWFETVYQDANDQSGKTLFGIYHNENYPSTLPYNPATGEGYTDDLWPIGLFGPTSPAAVPRIGIMKSTDGGRSWDNRGLFIEDKKSRITLRPHNNALCFAGGVGDPSAVASGDYLYLFYGEYGFPGDYDSATYNPEVEWSGQCISVARIALIDMEEPGGKAKRCDGNGFNASWDGIGKPIASLQIPLEEGGGAVSSEKPGFHWGPSVSWNTYLNCWVMLMGKVTGTTWQGNSLYISFNPHQDLGEGNNAQDWSKPQLLVERPGHILWYPSLQPMNTEEDIKNKHTTLRLGKRARLFFKYADLGKYMSEYIIEFEK